MQNWKELVRQVAPTLSAALGGPLTGTAVRFIADKCLGKPDAGAPDAGVEEVALAMQGANPSWPLARRDSGDARSCHRTFDFLCGRRNASRATGRTRKLRRCCIRFNRGCDVSSTHFVRRRIGRYYLLIGSSAFVQL
jgi:hypothetical protein